MCGACVGRPGHCGQRGVWVRASTRTPWQIAPAGLQVAQNRATWSRSTGEPRYRRIPRACPPGSRRGELSGSGELGVDILGFRRGAQLPDSTPSSSQGSAAVTVPACSVAKTTWCPASTQDPATVPRPPSRRNPGQEVAAAGASDRSAGPMPGCYTLAGRACRAGEPVPQPGQRLSVLDSAGAGRDHRRADLLRHHHPVRHPAPLVGAVRGMDRRPGRLGRYRARGRGGRLGGAAGGRERRGVHGRGRPGAAGGAGDRAHRNYFNQELYGKPSSLPWAVKIDHSVVSGPAYPPGTTFQPSFLYELIFDLALAGVLVWLGHHRTIRAQGLFTLYVAWLVAADPAAYHRADAVRDVQRVARTADQERVPAARPGWRCRSPKPLRPWTPTSWRCRRSTVCRSDRAGSTRPWSPPVRCTRRTGATPRRGTAARCRARDGCLTRPHLGCGCTDRRMRRP